MTYNVPGVYVEEISTLPPSVAGVATAIPAFIGYTEKALDKKGNSLPDTEIVVRRVDTLLEYEQYFGDKPRYEKFQLIKNQDLYELKRSIAQNSNEPHFPSHMMYYALRMYFDNGGGSCYIVSVARYSPTVEAPKIKSSELEAELIKKGIDKLKEYDEPTLFVLADAIKLSPNDYYARCVQVMEQCGLLGDRFGIFDVLDGDQDASVFREKVSSDSLKYGAAYLPYLRTSLTFKTLDKYVEIGEALFEFRSDDQDNSGIKVLYPDLQANSPIPSIQVEEIKETGGPEFKIVDEEQERSLIIYGAGSSVDEIIEAWNASKEDKGGFVLMKDEKANEESDLAALTKTTLKRDGKYTLADIKGSFTQLYNNIKAELALQRVILPPSSAIAGVYARVDRDRGVWKAPANVSIASLIEPIHNITNQQQERLNVDPTSGKSINAIRFFTGKGTLIWGARTLAGNDNEWRYINVRRLFNYMEESIKKATSFAVFEPNNATTWLKVKGLIESFLYGLWQQGALAGPTAESAYFVHVGLGKTMTPQDVLEGRLIVEIGVAASRPAEFIILRFMHKLQEA